MPPQTFSVLQMPTLELQAHLAEVLESNVMLEQEEPEAEGDREGMVKH